MVRFSGSKNSTNHHPADPLLYTELLPTVWCHGCGIGTTVHAFIQALKDSSVEPKKVCVVSGLGCTGKISTYIKLRSHSAPYGNVVGRAAELKKENPHWHVVVFLNNADFLLTGARDFIDEAQKGTDLMVLYINNFLYTLNKTQAFPMTPFIRKSVDGKFDLPFNIPHLAKTYGARYVARWTPLQSGWLKHSLSESLFKREFGVIEVVSPCLMFSCDEGRIQDAGEKMKFYDDRSEFCDGENTENLDLRKEGKIRVGLFIESGRPLQEDHS